MHIHCIAVSVYSNSSQAGIVCVGLWCCLCRVCILSLPHSHSMYSHSHSTPDGGGQPQTSLANGLKERRQRLRPGLRLAEASWKLHFVANICNTQGHIHVYYYKGSEREKHCAWLYIQRRSQYYFMLAGVTTLTAILWCTRMYDDYVLAQVAKFICNAVPYMYEMMQSLEFHGQGSICLSWSTSLLHLG